MHTGDFIEKDSLGDIIQTVGCVIALVCMAGRRKDVSNIGSPLFTSYGNKPAWLYNYLSLFRR